MNGSALSIMIFIVAAAGLLLMSGIGFYCGWTHNWWMLVGCTVAWLLLGGVIALSLGK